jgi:hypothetical protein
MNHCPGRQRSSRRASHLKSRVWRQMIVIDQCWCLSLRFGHDFMMSSLPDHLLETLSSESLSRHRLPMVPKRPVAHARDLLESHERSVARGDGHVTPALEIQEFETDWDRWTNQRQLGDCMQISLSVSGRTKPITTAWTLHNSCSR